MSVLVLAGGALALAVAVVLRWQRRGRAAQRHAIRLVTSRYLGGKRFLTVVEVEGHRLLLGLAGDRVSLVARLDAPAAPLGGEGA
ncbi:MAG TPA: flagellar biosynthetic protein FliO [Candidatus Binatia bacterium]|nr:flagellar biosynthetic protein FliO [Candidatus Binatia bacterium]